MLTPEKFSFRKWHIFILVLSGSLVRLIYGVYSNAWMAAPDQIAWGLSLDELIQNGSFSYKQLIHYPHEGGSLLISLVAICLKPFNFILPQLSLAALVIDSLSRWIQIKVVHRLYGTLTAVWFSLWTVFAVPLLLPWGTVNFGLHSLAAFCPFIFIYLFVLHSGNRNHGLWCGIATGLSIWFSYDNLILIPVFVVLKFIDSGTRTDKMRSLGVFLGITTLLLVPHILLRFFADSGFHLEKLGAISIRGVVWNNLWSNQFLQKIIAVWEQHLTSSFFLSSGTLISMSMQRSLVILFFITALLIVVFKKFKTKRNEITLLLIILVYTLAFAASPFYSEFKSEKSYVYFRHFAFIVPLFSLFIIHALLQTWKIQPILAGSWLVICIYFSLAYVYEVRPQQSASYRAAGWVLARKYGELPEKLKQLRDVAPASEQEELMVGFGWGLTATLLEGGYKADKNQITKLNNLLSQFDTADREWLRIGIDQAFAPGITPKLDEKFLNEIAK